MLGMLPLLLLINACSSDDPDERAIRDREKILEYLEENDLDYYELESGVFIVIEEEGTGSNPNENSTVRMSYQGYLLNGEMFDSATNVNIFLPNTVRGFRKGVVEFKRGGNGIILIPSALGYGTTGTGTVPRNSVLIFHVEIIDFT
ncbi:MAG: peptidylprolyl isomerase [Bacteroidia bacterium]|nr:MAG: peptidylprolyl isomerase [Bacteroidia bacterium]